MREQLVLVCSWLMSLIQQGNAQYQTHGHDSHTHDHVNTYQRVNHSGMPIDNSGCRGILKAPCTCRPTEVTCVNAQFTDTDIFLNINNAHFRYLTRVTFQGNNFRHLPKAVFGVGTGMEHSRLVMLNLSSNYIVHLDSEALIGVPQLTTLDMADNEIVLSGNETRFFAHTPHLLNLMLRRAFNPNVNQTLQTILLGRMFQAAKLKKLTYLDLSYNGLTSLPYDLGCDFPELTTLDLSINRLKTLKLNGTCFKRLDTLNVGFNQFTTLGLDLRLTAAGLPDYSLRASNNRYLCDCNSNAAISWMRSTNKIQDRDAIQCHRTSPEEFDHTKMMEIPLDKLDCTKNLTSSALADLRTLGFSNWHRVGVCLVIDMAVNWVLV